MSVTAIDKRTWGFGRGDDGILARWSGCCPAQMGDKGIWLEGPTWQLEQRSAKGDPVTEDTCLLTPRIACHIPSTILELSARGAGHLQRADLSLTVCLH